MKRLLTLAAFLFLATGCAAARSAPEGYYPVSRVDQPPELLDCSDYEAPFRGGEYRAKVIFDITPEGEVVNVRAEDIVKYRRVRVADVARRAAISCRYRPAIKDGEAVGVTNVMRIFAFETPDGE